MTAPLPPVEAEPRLAALRQRLHEAGHDGMIVSALSNVRYLTGFTGSAGVLGVTADRAVLFTDGRYQAQAPAELGATGAPVTVDADHVGRRDAVNALLDGVETVALEADSVTWSEQQSFAEWLGADRLVSSVGLVEGLRAVKDDAELARMERAATVAADALAVVVAEGLGGRTEREIGHRLDDLMWQAGATGPAYETIVASGPNAALPHARPGDRTVAPGDLVIIDVGALVDGYRSDMTRTFSIGDPTAEAQHLLDVVTEAQAAGVATIGDGVEVAAVDRAARGVIDDHGLAELFNHGTGHGVGLDIHEAPSVHGRATDTLTTGHCITVEPGVYRPGFGGVRVEDLLVVTADGARSLTTAPKDPVAA